MTREHNIIITFNTYTYTRTNNGRDNIWRLIALIECVATLLTAMNVLWARII